MKKTEVVVIGAGPGGYVAAIRAAQMGKKVTVIESEKVGGVCLNVGCIPSKALIEAGHRYQESLHSQFLGVNNSQTKLDFKRTQEWKSTQVVQPLTSGVAALLQKNKVDLIKGTAIFKDKHTVEISQKNGKIQLSFEQAIIATGSHPIEIPGFKFQNRVMDSTSVLDLKEVPEKLLVIGGGYIGCELASAYADLGSQVTIIEGTSQILPNFEQDIAMIVEKEFTEKGIKVLTNAKAESYQEKNQKVELEISYRKKKQNLDGDYILVTVGRAPNTKQLGLEKIGIATGKQGLIQVDEQYRTSVANIFAIGDVIAGPALAHKASYDGKVAAEVIAGKNVKKDYLAIPAICFTTPEIATVGLTKKEAMDKGIQAKSVQFPFQANGRALTLHAEKGFVRLVYEEGTEEILGVQMIGPHVSDLIGEITLAIECSLTLTDIALTIHGHPTLSEVIMDASEAGLGLPIHM